MTLLLALTLACKGGDSPAGDDSHVGTVDSEDSGETGLPEVLNGEDIGLVSGTTLAVFLSRDEALAETSELSLPLVESAAWTALADFDGDGWDDIWQVPDGRAKVFVHPNDGEGGFPEEAVFEPSTGLLADYKWLAGDFNGDGLDDIAQLNSSDRFVFLPNVVGSFDSDARVATATPFSQTGAWASGDVDGDGTDDVLWFKDGVLSVYRAAEGVLEADPMLSFDAPEVATHALLFDLGDDGLAELALWSGSTLRVYPNTGGDFDLDAGVAVSLNRPGDPVAGQVR